MKKRFGVETTFDFRTESLRSLSGGWKRWYQTAAQRDQALRTLRKKTERERTFSKITHEPINR